MEPYDLDSPYCAVEAMRLYRAKRKRDARLFGPIVKAIELTNRQYLHRHHELGEVNNMRPPPGSAIHIMPGYLVVRKLGTREQYETWMPDDLFEELYEPA